jgi:hypothetical protein
LVRDLFADSGGYFVPVLAMIFPNLLPSTFLTPEQQKKKFRNSVATAAKLRSDLTQKVERLAHKLLLSNKLSVDLAEFQAACQRVGSNLNFIFDRLIVEYHLKINIGMQFEMLYRK